MLMRAGACKKIYSKVVLSLEHKGTFYRLLLQTGYAQYNRYPICDIMDVLSTTIDTKRHYLWYNSNQCMNNNRKDVKYIVKLN